MENPVLPSSEKAEAAYGGLGRRDVELSPAITTVAFQPVLPPLRIPVPAGPDDEPEKGPFLLAFQDEDTWRRAWMQCEDSFASQCEVGARMGCSLRASEKCRMKWWEKLLNGARAEEEEFDKRREACEEKEMIACLAHSKEACLQHAEKKCTPAFRNQFIARSLGTIQPQFLDNRAKRQLLLQARENQAMKKEEIPNRTNNEPSEKSPGARLAQQAQNFTSSLFVREEADYDRRDVKGGESPKSNVRSTSRLPKGGLRQRGWVDEHGNVQGREGLRVEKSTEGWVGGLINPKVSKISRGSVDGGGKVYRKDSGVDRAKKEIQEWVRHFGNFLVQASEQHKSESPKRVDTKEVIKISDIVSIEVSVKKAKESN